MAKTYPEISELFEKNNFLSWIYTSFENITKALGCLQKLQYWTFVLERYSSLGWDVYQCIYIILGYFGKVWLKFVRNVLEQFFRNNR